MDIWLREMSTKFCFFYFNSHFKKKPKWGRQSLHTKAGVCCVLRLAMHMRSLLVHSFRQ
jgi:hypothetical protein